MKILTILKSCLKNLGQDYTIYRICRINNA